MVDEVPINASRRGRDWGLNGIMSTATSSATREIKGGRKASFSLPVLPEETVPGVSGLALSLQHLFAMFGATVLVPYLTGFDPSVALFTGGVGTLIYILVTGGKIPAYLGSSFAIIGAMITASKSWGPGAAVAGALGLGIAYVLIALVIGRTGTGWVDRLLPPPVVGAVVIVIGLGLAQTALGMAKLLPGANGVNPLSRESLVALATLLIIMIAGTALRGFARVVPVLIGIAGGYVIALLVGLVDWKAVAAAPWFALPHFVPPTFDAHTLPAVLLIAPIAIVLVTEHIGHLLVTAEIVGRPFAKDPGLHRSLLGDGLASTVAALVGGPPATTYGENIGVMAITRVYSVRVLGVAAVIAILLSFIAKLGALIHSIPTAVMGGVSIALFGVIAAAGMRLFVEHRVNLASQRNLLIVSAVLVLGVGGAHVNFGSFALDGMPLATIAGILLNLILPREAERSGA